MRRKTTAPGPYVPTESEEQQALFRWAAYEQLRTPELKALYHIPNGGKRSATEAKRFKAEGVKAGVPDICLPVARQGYNGLYIELKRTIGGKTSAYQREWIELLTREGYKAVVCCGWQEAEREIISYVQTKKH
jgi:hypothetical protein